MWAYLKMAKCFLRSPQREELTKPLCSGRMRRPGPFGNRQVVEILDRIGQWQLDAFPKSLLVPHMFADLRNLQLTHFLEH